MLKVNFLFNIFDSFVSASAYFLFKTISNPFISKTLTVFVKIALFFNLPISGLKIFGNNFLKLGLLVSILTERCFKPWRKIKSHESSSSQPWLRPISATFEHFNTFQERNQEDVPTFPPVWIAGSPLEWFFALTINAEILLITQGPKGVSLYSGKDYHHIITKARKVHDVSGAGDTVISTFSLSDICEATPRESAILANFAAGRVCEEVGVMPINIKMLDEILGYDRN